MRGIAALLMVSTDTVYELLASGQLPGRKIGRKWLTTRNAVMKWVEQSMMTETARRAARNGDDAALRAYEQGDREALGEGAAIRGGAGQGGVMTVGKKFIWS